MSLYHIVHPRFLLGALNLLPNLKKGVLNRISIFKGGCWEGGGDLFQGGVAVFA